MKHGTLKRNDLLLTFSATALVVISLLGSGLVTLVAALVLFSVVTIAELAWRRHQ